MANLLEGFQPEQEFADDNGISRRQVARYRNEPDGLPYMYFGGRVWIDIEGGREWIKRRVINRNPTRTRRAA